MKKNCIHLGFCIIGSAIAILKNDTRANQPWFLMGSGGVWVPGFNLLLGHLALENVATLASAGGAFAAICHDGSVLTWGLEVLWNMFGGPQRDGRC